MIIKEANFDLWILESISNEGSNCDPECSCVCGNDGDDTNTCGGSVTN